MILDFTRVFTITLVVTDLDITEKKLRWLLEEAGEVHSIKEEK